MKKTWDTKQLLAEFEVHSFLAPFVMVTRKSDKAKGIMQFTHSPRLYFDFEPDAPAAKPMPKVEEEAIQDYTNEYTNL